MALEVRTGVQVPAEEVGVVPQTVPKGAEVRPRAAAGPTRAEEVARGERLLAEGASSAGAVPAAVAAEAGPPSFQVVVGAAALGRVVVGAETGAPPFRACAPVARVAVPAHAPPCVGVPRPLAHNAADGRVVVAAPRYAVPGAAEAIDEATPKVAVVGR